MQILSGSIDLSKIDKTKIKSVTLKDGSKAQFLDIQVILNDQPDNYGNHAGVVIGQSKEERESKSKRTYLGNLKSTFNSESKESKESKKSDLPF